jgi:16S rRNA (adenine1518-N6/adenine1519-N6)-dimethyltransferase
MTKVRPKKHLGQHFLRAPHIAEKIAALFSPELVDDVLEIGPGTGVLTAFLLPRVKKLHAIELDRESVLYLETHFKEENFSILPADFLKFDLIDYFKGNPFGVIGNFPYNISSQILFKVLEHREHIPFFAGMFQKEVAQRICHAPGSKSYGILSVLTQTYYEVKYCFSVPPEVFDPPPKVDSGVLSMRRKKEALPKFDEQLYFRIIKTSFQQRRKTLRNSLKTLGLPAILTEDSIFDERPEKLSFEAFISLTQKIENAGISNR